MASPKILGVVETAVHVEDVEKSARFNEHLFGFTRMASDDRLCAFNVSVGHVLLLFRRGGTAEPVHTSGGVIPPHDGSGRMHFALAIAAADWDSWLAQLKAAGVTVESIVNWPSVGRSIYFRDPDNHLVELATPGLWPNY